MKIRILETPQGVARLVAGTLWQYLEDGAEHLGLATGRTMVDVYREFINMARDRHPGWNWDPIETFNLDEYVGLGPQDKESFHYFMWSHLFSGLSLTPGQTNLLNGLARDLTAECLRYEDLVTCKGIDVQLLGLGTNGHIGFNEPGTPFSARTHVVNLTPATLEQNQEDFLDRIPPRYALTMGIETILSAKHIILVATGASKAKALYETLIGPVGPHCPATALRLHQDVWVYLDQGLWTSLGLEARDYEMADGISLKGLED